MTVTCEFCNKKISTKSNLKQHQKSKACLEKQGQKISTIYKCKGCDKIFTTLQRLNTHEVICPKRIEDTIEEKEKIIKEKEKIINSQNIRIKQLEAQIEILTINEEKNRNEIFKLAQQPRTSNTTNNNLIIPNIDTSQEKINKAVENSYDMNHFCSGQKGIARFAVDHILRDEKKQLGYICTDPARSVFKHVGEDGEIVRDMKATRLTTKLAVPIKEKAGKLATEMIDKDRELISTATENLMDIRLIENDNSVFRTELASATSN